MALAAAVNFVSILRVQCVAALCWVRIANVVHAEKREYLWFLAVPDYLTPRGRRQISSDHARGPLVPRLRNSVPGDEITASLE